MINRDSLIDWESIVTDVYEDISFDMEPNELYDVIDKIVAKHGVKDAMDFLTLGIFVGDVWRPPGDDEMEQDEP